MGELARKPGCPTLPETPLELLTPRPGESFWPMERRCWQVAGGVSGFFGMVLINKTMRRPIWASLPLHALLIASGWYGTTIALDSIYASKSEEDAVYKHYISLHPEDFPPFDRKRWGDLYLPFKPVR